MVEKKPTENFCEYYDEIGEVWVSAEVSKKHKEMDKNFVFFFKKQSIVITHFFCGFFFLSPSSIAASKLEIRGKKISLVPIDKDLPFCTIIDNRPFKLQIAQAKKEYKAYKKTIDACAKIFYDWAMASKPKNRVDSIEKVIAEFNSDNGLKKAKDALVKVSNSRIKVTDGRKQAGIIQKETGEKIVFVVKSIKLKVMNQSLSSLVIILILFSCFIFCNFILFKLLRKTSKETTNKNCELKRKKIIVSSKKDLINN
jgi:hypothetical protein